jgi:hypothetical protein
MQETANTCTDLWVDVTEGHAVVVFKDYVRWDSAAVEACGRGFSESLVSIVALLPHTGLRAPYYLRKYRLPGSLRQRGGRNSGL